MIALAELVGGAARLARTLPWQAWAVSGAVAIGLGLYGCHEREAGGDAARQEIRRSNDAARKKADDATRSVENCVGVWDRARGVCLRDGAGR